MENVSCDMRVADGMVTDSHWRDAFQAEPGIDCASARMPAFEGLLLKRAAMAR